MLRILPTFHADVFYKSNIGTEEQRQSMIDQALAERSKNDKTLAWTNRGCWRSYFLYNNIDWLMEEVRDSVRQAGFHYQEQDPIYKKKAASFTGSEIKYWTNINRTGGKNATHDHRLWHYVAVYYLQAEGTGDLTFYNPINLTESCNPYAPFVSPISLSPKNGDLVVWPAWLPHEVEHNFSDKERINVAMNIRFKTPMSLEDVEY